MGSIGEDFVEESAIVKQGEVDVLETQEADLFSTPIMESKKAHCINLVEKSERYISQTNMHEGENDEFIQPRNEPPKMNLSPNPASLREGSLLPLEKKVNVLSPPRFANNLTLDLSKLPPMGNREFKLPKKLPPLKPLIRIPMQP